MVRTPRYKRLRLAALSVLLALGVAGLRPATALAQATEPDNDTDAYDQATCNDVQEDDVPDTSHTAVEDPGGKVDLGGSSSQDLGNDANEFSPFPKNNFWPTFNTSGGGNGNSSTSFEPNYTAQDKALSNDSFVPEPQVSFSQTGDAVPGQQATVIIQARGFSGSEVPGQQLYFATWLDGKYLNGQLAGGDQAAYDEQTVAASDPARPDCGMVGRQTHRDTDGDGMDDSWELAHGLNPNDPGDAGQDPDGDGYCADAFKNRAGDALVPSPDTTAGPLGSCSLTNLQEYILGTDPNVPDTDGDGYLDGQDAVGLGQNVVQFNADKAPQDGPYQVHTIVVGYLEKHDAEAQRLAKIDSSTYQVLQHSDQDLQVDLQVVNPGVKAAEVLEVAALPHGSSTPDLLATYRWFVNGQLQTALSGQSKRTLRYTVPDGTRPGTQFAVAVEVVDPQNGQLARGRTAITVGDTVLLVYDPEQVDAGTTVDVQAQLSAGQSPADHLFIWSIDDQEQTAASRVGAATLSWTPSVSGGERQRISVRVLDRTSHAIGHVEQAVAVQAPTVQLELNPAAPQAEQTVTVRAATAHTGSAALEYSFSVDGTPLGSSATPTVSLSAGAAGTTHTIDVVVRTVGATPAAAAASTSFTTRAAGSTALSTSRANVPFGGGRSPLLASALNAQQGVGYGVLSAVVALGLGVVVARQTRSWRST